MASRITSIQWKGLTPHSTQAPLLSEDKKNKELINWALEY